MYKHWAKRIFLPLKKIKIPKNTKNFFLEKQIFWRAYRPPGLTKLLKSYMQNVAEIPT